MAAAAIICITAVFSGCQSIGTDTEQTTASQTTEAADTTVSDNTNDRIVPEICGTYDCIGVLDSKGYAVSAGDGEYLCLRDGGTGYMFFALDEQDEEFPITWTYENGSLMVYDAVDENDEGTHGTYDNGVISLEIDTFIMLLAKDSSSEWQEWNADKEQFNKNFLGGKYFGAMSYNNEPESGSLLTDDDPQKDAGSSTSDAFDPDDAYRYTITDITNKLIKSSPGDSNWIFEITTYNKPAEEHCGYMYHDINGDGRQELIICSSDKEDGNVFAVYTCNDGEITQIVDGWSRNRYSITTDGHILNSGSNGAAYSSFGVYRINDSCDNIECVDYYFTDSINGSDTEYGTYHNTSGKWDINDSELIKNSTDGFFELGSEFTELELKPTLFTELVKAQSAKIAHLSIAGSEDIGTPADYTEFNTGITEYGVPILISSDKNANVILLSIQMSEDNYSFNVSELFEADITPEKPVLTTVSFPGSIPSYGIEVTDETGTRFYAIEMSGMDGSLLLTEIEVNNVDHARG